MTQKTIFCILLSAFLFPAFSFSNTIIFVKEGGTGNGTSWEDATGDLQAALFIAEVGDQIWVTKGTYFPTNTNDRKRFFQIPDGVKVFGGFLGNETQRSQRDWKKHKTILSGEIGSQDAKDNSYTIVYTKNVSKETLLDGFTIAGGQANTGNADKTWKKGGGWYNDGSGWGNQSNPTIQNCVFFGNYARDGGALYNDGEGGEASPRILNCRFILNHADLDGGGIFNNGRKRGTSNPIISNCQFEGNFGNYGGAVFNYGGLGDSSPTIVKCEFLNNEAYNSGAGIYNMDVEGQAAPNINHCKFLGNNPSEAVMDLKSQIEGESGKQVVRM